MCDNNIRRQRYSVSERLLNEVPERIGYGIDRYNTETRQNDETNYLYPTYAEAAEKCNQLNDDEVK